jgi:hypothetical protein
LGSDSYAASQIRRWRKRYRLVRRETGLVWTNQILADEGDQMCFQRGSFELWSQVQDRASMEVTALDGGALQHSPLVHWELVQPGPEERLDRRWRAQDSDRFLQRPTTSGAMQGDLFGQHGQHLLEE